MQTKLVEPYKSSADGKLADAILRSCVHCGFCTATCPTYQLLADEPDGPRGRIYLIKRLLEGEPVGRTTQIHLDRCLTCRACETTCPSGVRYGRLADIGRQLIDKQVKRPWRERAQRWLLTRIAPYPKRFAMALKLARLARPLLPKKHAVQVPTVQTTAPGPAVEHARRVVLLEGCVQSVVTPNTNTYVARVLDQLGISTVTASEAGCCGAVEAHLSEQERAHQRMRTNIDTWWPHIEQGAEAIVISASGCSVMVKEYGELLQHDPDYAAKAAQISALARDVSEVIAAEDLSILQKPGQGQRIAFHSPCTLQHGQQINGVVETILQQAGYELTRVPDSHLCCGSAGTYSILQPALSQQLLDNKVNALQSDQPQLIATANIGCQLHIAKQAEIPVVHWLSLLLAENEAKQ